MRDIKPFRLFGKPHPADLNYIRKRIGILKQHVALMQQDFGSAKVDLPSGGTAKIVYVTGHGVNRKDIWQRLQSYRLIGDEQPRPQSRYSQATFPHPMVFVSVEGAGAFRPASLYRGFLLSVNGGADQYFAAIQPFQVYQNLLETPTIITPYMDWQSAENTLLIEGDTQRYGGHDGSSLDNSTYLNASGLAGTYPAGVGDLAGVAIQGDDVVGITDTGKVLRALIEEGDWSEVDDIGLSGSLAEIPYAHFSPDGTKALALQRQYHVAGSGSSDKLVEHEITVPSSGSVTVDSTTHEGQTSSSSGPTLSWTGVPPLNQWMGSEQDGSEPGSRYEYGGIQSPQPAPGSRVFPVYYSTGIAEIDDNYSSTGTYDETVTRSGVRDPNYGNEEITKEITEVVNFPWGSETVLDAVYYSLKEKDGSDSILTYDHTVSVRRPTWWVHDPRDGFSQDAFTGVMEETSYHVSGSVTYPNADKPTVDWTYTLYIDGVEKASTTVSQELSFAPEDYDLSDFSDETQNTTTVLPDGPGVFRDNIWAESMQAAPPSPPSPGPDVLDLSGSVFTTTSSSSDSWEGPAAVDYDRNGARVEASINQSSTTSSVDTTTHTNRTFTAGGNDVQMYYEYDATTSEVDTSSASIGTTVAGHELPEVAGSTNNTNEGTAHRKEFWERVFLSGGQSTDTTVLEDTSSTTSTSSSSTSAVRPGIHFYDLRAGVVAYEYDGEHKIILGGETIDLPDVGVGDNPITPTLEGTWNKYYALSGDEHGHPAVLHDPDFGTHVLWAVNDLVLYVNSGGVRDVTSIVGADSVDRNNPINLLPVQFLGA